MSITIGNSELCRPTGFTVTEREITREARLSSGLLVKDVIGTKKVFALDWGSLSGTNLALLKTEYDQHGFLNLEYPDNAGTQNATVAFAEFPRSLAFAPAAEDWIYNDVSIVLEEQ